MTFLPAGEWAECWKKARQGQPGTSQESGLRNQQAVLGCFGKAFALRLTRERTGMQKQWHFCLQENGQGAEKKKQGRINQVSPRIGPRKPAGSLVTKISEHSNK